jgi:hypothetical protein
MLGNWWRTRSYETKAGLGVLATLVLGIAGYVAATGLSKLAAEPAATDADVVLAQTETVERLLTVTGKGETAVVRAVQARIVRRVVTQRSGPQGTAVEYVTVTTPGRTERRVVRDRGEQVVTLPASVRTIVETRGGRTQTTVVTNQRVLTTERVVTDNRVVTDSRVVTDNRTVTDVRTQQETVPVTIVRTVTERVPVTQPVTVTATTTATQLLTQTVTQPAETLPPVTVTVRCPPKGC